MPKTIKIAVQLIALTYVTLLILVISDFTTYKLVGITPNTFYPYSIGYAVLDYCIYTIITGLCIYYMRRRSNLARFLYCIYIITSIGSRYFSHTIADTNLFTNLMILLYIGFQLIIITMLFSPDSNSWFSGQQQKPQPALPTNQACPTTVKLGIALQLCGFISFVIFHIVAYTYIEQVKPLLTHTNVNSALLIIFRTCITTIVTLVLLLATIKRISWARVALLVFAILQIGIQFYLHISLHLPYSCELTTYGYYIFTLSGLTLLFLPTSNSWFSDKTINA